MDSQEDHIEGGQVLGQPDLHPLKPQAVQDCSARGPLLSPSLAPHRGAEQDWSSRKIQIFKGLQPVEVAGLGGLASRARTSQVLHFLRLCETVGCHVSEESTTSQASAKVLTLERHSPGAQGADVQAQRLGVQLHGSELEKETEDDSCARPPLYTTGQNQNEAVLVQQDVWPHQATGASATWVPLGAEGMVTRATRSEATPSQAPRGQEDVPGATLTSVCFCRFYSWRSQL